MPANLKGEAPGHIMGTFRKIAPLLGLFAKPASAKVSCPSVDQYYRPWQPYRSWRSTLSRQSSFRPAYSPWCLRSAMLHKRAQHRYLDHPDSSFPGPNRAVLSSGCPAMLSSHVVQPCWPVCGLVPRRQQPHPLRIHAIFNLIRKPSFAHQRHPAP